MKVQNRIKNKKRYENNESLNLVLYITDVPFFFFHSMKKVRKKVRKKKIGKFVCK